MLQAGVGDRSAAKGAILRSTPELHTVTVEHGGRAFALTLKRTGKRGGTLSVTQTTGGESLYRGEFPGAVEDHYRHYKDDPHYKLWVTDPRYRVTIEPTAEDEILVK